MLSALRQHQITQVKDSSPTWAGVRGGEMVGSAVGRLGVQPQEESVADNPGGFNVGERVETLEGTTQGHLQWGGAGAVQVSHMG